MAFDIRSDLPIESIPLLFPVEGPALVEPLTLTAPPSLHLAGELFGPGRPEKNQSQDYVLEVATAAPLHYQGFPLDHLSLRVERHGEELFWRISAPVLPTASPRDAPCFPAPKSNAGSPSICAWPRRISTSL